MSAHVATVGTEKILVLVASIAASATNACVGALVESATSKAIAPVIWRSSKSFAFGRRGVQAEATLAMQMVLISSLDTVTVQDVQV